MNEESKNHSQRLATKQSGEKSRNYRSRTNLSIRFKKASWMALWKALNASCLVGLGKAATVVCRRLVPSPAVRHVRRGRRPLWQVAARGRQVAGRAVQIAEIEWVRSILVIKDITGKEPTSLHFLRKRQLQLQPDDKARRRAPAGKAYRPSPAFGSAFGNWKYTF